MNQVREIFSWQSPTGQQVTVRSWTFPSSNPSAPTYTFVAGLHGDEQAGIAVCLSLLRDLTVQSEVDAFEANARVIACANPLSLLVSTRTAPTDNADWNRLRPIDNGDFGERIIHSIVDEASDSTYLIDLHGGENFVRHVPQAIIFPSFFPEDPEHEEKALKIATRLRLPLVQVEEESERSPFKHTVAYSVARASNAIPIIIELGVGSRVYPNETARLAQALAALVCPSAVIGAGGKSDLRIPMRKYSRQSVEFTAAERGGIFSPIYSRLYQTLLNLPDLDIDELSSADAANVGQIARTLPDTHFQLVANTQHARDLLERIFRIARSEGQVLLASSPSGQLRMLTVRPGDIYTLRSGAALGNLFMLDGSPPMEVKAPTMGPEGGLLIAVRRHPLVYEGSTLAAFATEWDILDYIEPL